MDYDQRSQLLGSPEKPFCRRHSKIIFGSIITFIIIFGILTTLVLVLQKGVGMYYAQLLSWLYGLHWNWSLFRSS